MAKKSKIEFPNNSGGWGPKLPVGGAKGTAKQKSATYGKTIADLNAYRKAAGKDEMVMGVNSGPNSEKIRRAASTGNRLTDYSKTSTRLMNSDARSARSTKYRAKKAALAKAKKGK